MVNPHLKAMRAMLAAGLAVLGAGCASVPGLSDLGLGDSGGDFTSDAPAGLYLTNADRTKLSAAFEDAVRTGEMQSWRGRAAFGAVEPQSYALGNLLGDPARLINARRADLDLSHVVETELGLHVLTRNSNIRIGPGTEYKIAEVASSGAGVDVVGRVRDRNWYLVAIDGVVRGYIFGDLVVKAPGTELELAGGPMRKPILCRRVVNRASLSAERYEWQSAACNDGAGWRHAPEPAAEGDDELLGF